MSMLTCSLLSLGCAFGFVPPEDKAAWTALHAFRVAQRRLKPEVRAKLLGVVSSWTVTSAPPVAWRFIFLDASTSGRRRVVTVAAKASSEHPETVEAFDSVERAEGPSGGGSSHPITQAKWVIDSDRAHEIARAVVKMRGVHACEFDLAQHRSQGEPYWTIRYCTEKDEPVVVVQVSARTGEAKVLHEDGAGRKKGRGA